VESMRSTKKHERLEVHRTVRAGDPSRGTELLPPPKYPARGSAISNIEGHAQLPTEHLGAELLNSVPSTPPCLLTGQNKLLPPPMRTERGPPERQADTTIPPSARTKGSESTSQRTEAAQLTGPMASASDWMSMLESVHPEPSGKVTLLFDLNGVLIQSKCRGKDGRGYVGLQPFVPRPGVEHLVSLLPHFRLGLFTSASFKTVSARIDQIQECIFGNPILAVRFFRESWLRLVELSEAR
jgi:hypothetical protein